MFCLFQDPNFLPPVLCKEDALKVNDAVSLEINETIGEGSVTTHKISLYEPSEHDGGETYHLTRQAKSEWLVC